MPMFRFGHDWDPLGDLEREVDQMLHSVNMTLQGLRVGRPFPPVNLYERDDEYLLTAELPGTKLEDLELTYASGILTLKGRRFDAAEVDEHRFRRRERFHGEWQRSVSLPERVNQEDVSATFADGILKVTLPKGAASPVRQITVTDGTGPHSNERWNAPPPAQPPAPPVENSPEQPWNSEGGNHVR